MLTTAAIALGGNVGNVPETFSKVLAAIQAIPDTTLLACSRNFATQPIGAQAGSPFVNAVALLEVICSPLELLVHLQRIENDLGRVRTVRWGPRTIDLDILSYGEEILEIDAPRSPAAQMRATLIIPHPACWYRRFVLDPWCDVAPDWRHPVLGETVRELRDRLLHRPLGVCIIGDHRAAPEHLAAVLRGRFPLSAVDISVVGSGTKETRQELILELTPADGRGAPTSGVEACRRQLRIVPLTVGPETADMAVQIFRAALDEPVPIPTGNIG